MDVNSYIEHYEKRKNWTHLSWPKHQERLKECAMNLVGHKFADVGCVFGHSTHYLSKFKPGDWTGIDFSRRAIVGSIQNFPKLKFMFLNSMKDLDSIESFDSVVCSEVIEHVEDDRSLLNKLLEITKKILVITTPCVSVISVGHLRLYDKEMLEKLFEGLKYKLYKKGTFWYGIIENG